MASVDGDAESGLRATARTRRRAFVGASVGNAIEWYDFAVYGFLASFIGAAFFPSADPATQLLSSFAVFGLTFLARPLGGLFFGPMADRLGRKRTLVVVVTMMAVSTTLIGVLPGYATIGIAAPVLLVVLRLLQGFSAGGEYGSASTFMAEYAAAGRRAFGTSWMMFSTIVGFLVGSLLAGGLGVALGTPAMGDWGWRIPFLVAGPLGAIALYIRLRLEDTPEFRALQEGERTSGSPLRETLRHRRALLIVAGIGALHATAFYLVFTYLATYLAKTAELGPGTVLVSTLVAGAVALAVLPAAATVADRVGRRPVLLAAAVGFAVCAYPAFLLLGEAGAAGAVVGHAVLAVLLACFISTSVTTMAELFPSRIRASGVSLGYNIPAALFGGTAPFVATFLVESTGNPQSPAFYFIVVALVGIVALLPLRREDLYDAPAVGADAEIDERTAR
ncbi:MFS transporter [Pseudonocardia pini]|uniref:MFS transporter n=1 Tax=Pseudonocardia pini TaxID=2758030 RepID=UPI0015EFEF0A|nr:MFS transporter [Pseudonocardia pini]